MNKTVVSKECRFATYVPPPERGEPDLHVVKVSFPRPVVQGSLHDRDMHAGQHHVPLANVVVPSRGEAGRAPR